MITADQRQAEIERHLDNIEKYLLGMRLQLAAMQKGRGSPDTITLMIHHTMCSVAYAGTLFEQLASLPKPTVKPTLEDERFNAAGQDDTLQKLLKRAAQKTPIRGSKRKTGGAK